MLILNFIKKIGLAIGRSLYAIYRFFFIRPKELMREAYFERGHYDWYVLRRKITTYSNNIPFIGVTDQNARRHFRDWHTYPKATYFVTTEYLGGYVDEYEKALTVQDQNEYLLDDLGSGIGHTGLFVAGELFGGNDLNFSPFIFSAAFGWFLIWVTSVLLVILDQGFASWAWYTIFKDYSAIGRSHNLEFRNVFSIIYMLLSLWCQDPYWVTERRGDWFEISNFYEGVERDIIRAHSEWKAVSYYHRQRMWMYSSMQAVESWLYNELNIDLKRSEFAYRVNFAWWFICFFKYTRLPWVDCGFFGGMRAQLNYFYYSKKIEYDEEGNLTTTIHRSKQWKRNYLRYVFYEHVHNDGSCLHNMLHNYGPDSRDFFHFSWLWSGFPKRDPRLEDFHFTFGSRTQNRLVVYIHKVFVKTDSNYGRRFISPMYIWFCHTYPFPWQPTYYYDAPRDYQLGFQDPATPIMEGIIDLHHDLFFFFIVIGCLVFWLIFRIIYFFQWEGYVVPENFFRNVKHHTLIEVIWTVTPALILVLIATPSFSLLYAMEDIIKPGLTIKVIGNQWYWSYEYFIYPTEENKELLTFTKTKNQTLEKIFDSYMIETKDLQLGEFRLLEVDNRVVVPTLTHIRFLITSSDVLHSFAIPSLGIKLDACPGRLNQTTAFITRQGLFYGQCSEICGINHAFMPIVIEAVDTKSMLLWLNK